MMKLAFLVICLIGAGFYFAQSGHATIPVSDPQKRAYAGIRESDMPGRFEPSAYLTPGVATVLVLCTRECPGCQSFKARHVPQYLSYRPDLSVQFIYMPWGIWRSGKTLEHYGLQVGGTPTIQVYGPNGKLIAADTPSSPDAGESVLIKAIEEAMNAQ